MNMIALGQLVISRKKVDFSEEEKMKRKSQLDAQKVLQKKESQRLMNLLSDPPSLRTEADSQSFIQNYGQLSFFRDYIQEGHIALVRIAFMKGERSSFRKGEFTTRKGDRNASMKIILEGQVGLYLEMIDSKYGKKQLILIRKIYAGESIEMGTLIEKTGYVMTTQAMTESVDVLSLPYSTFISSFYKYESSKYDADIDFLKGVPFFKEWPRRNLNSLQMCINKFQVTRSQVIFQEGQPSHALFIVKKGEFGLYRKRRTWEKSQNLQEETQDKLKRLEYSNKDLFGNSISIDNIPLEQGRQSQLLNENNERPSQTLSELDSVTPRAPQTLFRGHSKSDVAKKISGFLVTSAVEMNSDLLQTLTEFDSFGEKELLNGGPRQCSIVCKSAVGQLIQIKSKHFFILAQEEPELKYQIMTKLMVESKKAELQNMRYNLNFINENQMCILDNHLQSISNKDKFSAKFKLFEQQSDSNNDYQTDKESIQQNSIAGDITTTDKKFPSINRVKQRSNTTMHRSFSINKLSLNPNRDDDNRRNVAQLYYQLRKSKEQNELASPPSLKNNTSLESPKQNNEVQEQNLNSYLISKMPIVIDGEFPEFNSTSNNLSAVKGIHVSIPNSIASNNEISTNIKRKGSSHQITQKNDSKHHKTFSKPEISQSFSRNDNQAFFKQSNGNINRQGSQSSRRNDSNKDAQDDTQTIQGVKFPQIFGSTPQKESLPMFTNVASSHNLGISSGNGTQTSNFFDKNHHQGGQQKSNGQSNNILKVKRSFLLGNEVQHKDKDNSSSKYVSFPIDSQNGLPSFDFSSRPLMNSIAYSTLSLNI